VTDYLPYVIIVLQLIFLEGVLSIDNAAVLGVMVSVLPDKEPIPWPGWLKELGKHFDGLLGKQRMAALRVGLLGAYLGRGTMLLVTSFLINNSWVRLVGAAYLIRLAFDELGDTTPDEETEAERRAALEKPSFWSVVLAVEVLDLVFSIDNVIAAVSLSSDIWVVFVGVGLGILTMRFAAGWFSYAIEREPVLKPAAYILVFNIGVQLILEQIWDVQISDYLRFGISAAIIGGAVLYAHSKLLQRFHFVLAWISQGMGLLNALVDWALHPFVRTIKWVFRGFKPAA